MGEPEKKVDQEWKERAEREKEELGSGEGAFSAPEPTFSFFITTLSMQASIALGMMENPVTNKTEENLEQAKFLIETLAMLQDKTRNNLMGEEGKLLDNLLFELRNAYISKTKGVKS